MDALTSSFEPRGRESKHDHRLDSAQQLLLAEEAQEVVRWLTKDIERVASLFARQASVFSAAAVSSSELTVKLELLNKGKCPRFHLDKVYNQERRAPCFNPRFSHLFSTPAWVALLPRVGAYSLNRAYGYIPHVLATSAALTVNNFRN